MSEIEETAKATQEVAKATSNALDKAEKAGTFIAKYIDVPLTEITAIWNDKLKYRRWENQLNLWMKANKKLKNLGLDSPNHELPLKLGLPLIEAASLEEDDRLQELWANLLVNSSTGFSLERSYINVLEQLSLLEARILIEIYSNFEYKRNNIYIINSKYLPKFIQIKHIQVIDSKEEETILYDTLNDNDNDTILNSETHLALINLARLQCIEGSATFGGGTKYERITPTLFGAKLYEAVKEPTKQ